jgi:multidrug efflux pump subunit AcrB
VRTPASSSVEYARLKIENAATLAREIKEVKETNSRVDANGGRIRVDIGKKNTRERSAKEIAVELREKIKTLVGAEYVVLDELNNGSRKPIQIEFTGPDSRKLLEIANAYMAKLREVPGAVDVGLSEQDPKNELQIELDRGLANSMGISVNDAAQSLRVAFAGVEVGDWVDPTGESRDVAVRLHPDDRVNAENIERLPIAVTGTNEMVPLDQIAKITMGKGPSGIEHKDGNRTIAVSANAQGRSAGEVSKDAMALVATFDFPPGYGRELGGQGKSQSELMFNMVVALFAGVLLMYMILVIQFGSFTAPIAVMISLPLSLIGVVLALKLTGQSLNLMSMIGILMLMGLVAKNAILLLDAARRREAEGFDRESALMDAGRMRLRPILMTTFALIAGMVPVALGLGEGGEFYRPLAIAIIGGTITSTILTLLVVPTFYDSIEIKKDNMVVKFHRRSARFNMVVAFFMTAVEVVLMLTLIRFMFRTVVKLGRWVMRRFRGAAEPVSLNKA